MPPSLAQQDRPRAVLSLSVLKIPPRSRLHSLSQLPARDLIAQKHFLMAKLNLPGHDSSRVFFFSPISCTWRKHTLLSAEPRALGTCGRHSTAGDGPDAVGCVASVPADLGQRGTSPSTVWSSRNQSPTMERREKERGMFRAADNPASWHCLKMSNICLLPELPCAS